MVVRTDVYETDPKGIYFEESSITLDIGESYVPNVLGVATGRTVSATIEPGDGTSMNVIDIEDGDTIIGTQEGTAYVTATYQFVSANDTTTTYESSSMKVTVTDEIYDDEAEEDDDSDTSTYMVTASTLNVRTGPSTSYSKVGTLSRGTSVEVVGTYGNWAKLSNGYYVSLSYLSA